MPLVARAEGRTGLRYPDFNVAPLLTIWETTRSCALACSHCRAEASWGRHPFELSTEEGYDLIDEVAEMGTPLLILSGGDPLNRPDLEQLVRRGKARGLRVGTIPAATPLLTAERIQTLKEAGLDQIAFSLDAPTAEAHDNFRRSRGAFGITLQAAAWAKEAGLPLQINTCLAAWNYSFLEEMISLVKKLEVSFWEVFFMIPTGRAEDMSPLSPAQFERVFERMEELGRERRFILKLTEAQHYKSYARQNGTAVNAGKGFMFVDHLGNVCPSGFLPIAGSNIRTHTLSWIYRESKVFKELRDPKLLKGKCGRCRHSESCGGSRARAWAVTGDYLAGDPACRGGYA